jgi:glycosyltransferase involved in cell wall biosynthesis
VNGLRIGLVTNEWPSNRADSGGIGTYFHNLAVGMERCGAEPVVVTGAGLRRGREPTKHRFPVIHLPETKPSLAQRVLERLSGKAQSYKTAILQTGLRRRDTLGYHLPELIEQHGLEVLIGPLWAGELAEAAGYLDVPLVLRASSNIRPVVSANDDLHDAHDQRVHDLEQQALRTCSALYAPSPRALAALRASMDVPDVPTAVIPSGVDTDLFQPASAASRRQARRLLFAGRLEPQKGMRLLASALPRLLEQVQQAEVWFVGRDTPSAPEGVTWQEHFRRLCSEPVLARCRFLGRIPWAHMPETYRRCDLVLIPSVRDNLPNVALEALASGLPVVASDGAGLEDVVHPGRNGLILEGGNATAWIEALAALVAAPDRLKSMGESAAKTARSDLNLEAAAQPVIDLARRALELEAAPHPATASSVEALSI